MPKAKAKSDPEARPNAAVETEAPQLVVSDEFHLDVAEPSKTSTHKNFILVMVLILASGLLAFLIYWLMHDSPAT